MMGVGPGCSRVMRELLSSVLLAENISSASWGGAAVPWVAWGFPRLPGVTIHQRSPRRTRGSGTRELVRGHPMKRERSIS